jgi:hypothetical protein
MAQRPDILTANGQDPKLIRRLLEDAYTWHFLRRLLQDQVKSIKEFLHEYTELVGKDKAYANLVKSTESFEHDIGSRVHEFDVVSNSLIQLVS